MSFIDMIPGVSQVKSAVQLLCGDVDAAIKTQENFTDLCPGVSQLKSAIQIIGNDPEGAKETERKYYQNQMEIGSILIRAADPGLLSIKCKDKSKMLSWKDFDHDNYSLITEYAHLANKCYGAPGETLKLPDNWTSLLHYSRKDGNSYAFYMNKCRKEIVLGIKGTDNIMNILSDGKLLAGAFMGIKVKPIGQDHVSEMVYDILGEKDLSPGLKSAIHKVGDSIRKMDNDFSPLISNSTISDLYLSVLSLNFFLPSQLISMANISIISGGTIAPTMHSFQSASESVKSELATYLNNPGNSSHEFSNSLMDVKSYLKDYTFKIVGHSLGAVMAELCAAEMDVECIGFESPGSRELLKKREYKNITTYLSAPNIINTLYGHPGHSYRMFLPHTDGKITLGHIESCLWNSTSRVVNYATLGTFSAICAALSVGTKLVSGTFGLWTDIKWLLRQHSVDNIVHYLQDPQKKKIKAIKMWPILFETGTTEEAINIFRNTLMPFQKDLPGIRNINDEEGMREASIDRMYTYIVVE